MACDKSKNLLQKDGIVKYKFFGNLKIKFHQVKSQVPLINRLKIQ